MNELTNIPVCAVIVSSIFKEDNEYPPQVLLRDCFYEHKENINLHLCKVLIQYVYEKYFILFSDKYHYLNPLVV